MLDIYFQAFDDFLTTGAPDRLTRFTDAGTNPAYLNIYRNGHLKTCIDALAASFPVVAALVGEDYFRKLARGYVEAHPPTSGSLVGYGGEFATYLRSRTDEHGLAYLPDAAAIDAAWSTCFFAADGHALAANDVEAMNADGIDVATVHVGLTPPTQLVDLEHDLVETWARIREQGALTSAVSLHRQHHQVMLWRVGGQIHFKALESGESALLSAIAGVATLESAACSAFETDAAFDLAATFAALLQNRILQLESHSA